MWLVTMFWNHLLVRFRLQTEAGFYYFIRKEYIFINSVAPESILGSSHENMYSRYIQIIDFFMEKSIYFEAKISIYFYKAVYKIIYNTVELYFLQEFY